MELELECIKANEVVVVMPPISDVLRNKKFLGKKRDL